MARHHGATEGGLDRLEGWLLTVIGLYFTIGFILSTMGVSKTARSDLDSSAAGQQDGDTGAVLMKVYEAVFEPVNRPVRPFLPKGGLIRLFQIKNRHYFIDFAPLVMGILSLVATVLVFKGLRLAVGGGSGGEPVSPVAAGRELSRVEQAAANVEKAIRKGTLGRYLDGPPLAVAHDPRQAAAD